MLQLQNQPLPNDLQRHAVLLIDVYAQADRRGPIHPTRFQVRVKQPAKREQFRHAPAFDLHWLVCSGYLIE